MKDNDAEFVNIHEKILQALIKETNQLRQKLDVFKKNDSLLMIEVQQLLDEIAFLKKQKLNS